MEKENYENKKESIFNSTTAKAETNKRKYFHI